MRENEIMYLVRMFNVLRCSHPFSVFLATVTAILVSSKIVDDNVKLLHLSIVFLLSQLITGILNDYLDYEDDIQYQKTKPAVRFSIPQKDLKIGIIACTVILSVYTLLFLPILGSLVVFFGLMVAQTYNYGLKDTILSGLIFTTAFGLMMLVPVFVIDSDFPYSFTFLVSGGCVGFSIHLINAIMDIDTDQLRGARSMAVVLGKTKIVWTICSLMILIMILNQNIFVLTVGLLFIALFLISRKSGSYHLLELSYYGLSILSLALIYFIPIN